MSSWPRPRTQIYHSHGHLAASFPKKIHSVGVFHESLAKSLPKGSQWLIGVVGCFRAALGLGQPLNFQGTRSGTTVSKPLTVAKATFGLYKFCVSSCGSPSLVPIVNNPDSGNVQLLGQRQKSRFLGSSESMSSTNSYIISSPIWQEITLPLTNRATSELTYRSNWVYPTCQDPVFLRSLPLPSIFAIPLRK